MGPQVPDHWIIDFSDPIFGNRWAVDELALTVGGRSCPAKIQSTHDRRFVHAGVATSLLDHARGRGACTSHPPMPAINCAAEPVLALDECPELCGNCPGDSYCRCGTGTCVCPPGTSGPTCTPDLECGEHGEPVGRFLGAGEVVPEFACVCDKGWTGVNCEVSMPRVEMRVASTPRLRMATIQFVAASSTRPAPHGRSNLCSRRRCE